MATDETERLDESERKPREILEQLDRTLSFQAADGNELERKARLRHDRLFESALGADEHDAPACISRHVLARDRDGGIDMAAGSTAGDHQSLRHDNSSSSVLLLCSCPSHHTRPFPSHFSSIVVTG